MLATCRSRSRKHASSFGHSITSMFGGRVGLMRLEPVSRLPVSHNILLTHYLLVSTPALPGTVRQDRCACGASVRASQSALSPLNQRLTHPRVSLPAPIFLQVRHDGANSILNTTTVHSQ